MPPPAPKRLPAPQRRRLMLEAAVHVFGEHGYADATTDAIAREAGVSQAYVVRTFGSKESLYSEAAAYTFDAVREAFRSAPVPPGASSEQIRCALGDAYLELVADRSKLLMTMSLYTMGAHPVFGPLAREGFDSIYRVLRHERGLAADEATLFLARGMLINTVLGLRLWEGEGRENASELLSFLLDEDAEHVLAAAAAPRPEL